MTTFPDSKLGRLAVGSFDSLECFESFVSSSEAVDEPPPTPPPSALAAPLVAWPRFGDGAGVRPQLWAFSVRAVLRCDPLGRCAKTQDILGALVAPESYAVAAEMAADAHATVRDAAWEARGETRMHWARHRASQWGCSCEHLLTVLVDALVLAEWLDDVGYFGSSVSDETRRLWLRESVLWSRCLNPCTWAGLKP